MPGSKLRLIVNRVLLGIILLIGLVVLAIAGTIGAIVWHRIHVANIERNWVNPIKDETFQVDLDLDAEGQSYHITRAYRCDDVHIFTGGEHGIQRTVFPSQRIITQHLPSGHTVFVVVPNGCYPIWNMHVLHVPCERSNEFFIGAGRPQINCNSSTPVIFDHIPLVYWTEDTGKPKSLVAYMNAAAFHSEGALVRKATTMIKLEKGLTVSPPDENNWLGKPVSKTTNIPETKYFAYVAFDNKACWTGVLDWRLHAYGIGSPLPNQTELCLTPFDRDGNLIERLHGLLVLHSDTKTVARPAGRDADALVSAVGITVPSPSSR